MNILTTDLIRKSEQAAVQSGKASFLTLMENAGKAAAEIIDKKLSVQGKTVLVVAGKGNNGGDGFVVARFLSSMGADVKIYLASGLPSTENAKINFKKAENLVTEELPASSDIIIDAVFGIGLNSPLSEELINLFENLNKTDSKRVSIDIPSGVSADTGKIMGGTFKPHFTVTFISYKPCFYLLPASDICGEIIVADIGVTPIDNKCYVNQKPLFPPRNPGAHKGNFGTALLICGSYGMAGAALLATEAALRSGLGIAKCVIVKSIYEAFTARLPEAVCIPSNETADGKLDSNSVDTKSLQQNCTALLFGPGIGISADGEKILEDILINTKIPTVIDADGINLISRRIELLQNCKAPLILTPHPGEMARLTGKTVAEVEENRFESAREFAKKYGCILVLKGADTIIAEPDGTLTVQEGKNPGMATGGSGDVLTGITVSLLAQGYSASFAAKAAVYIHSTAGNAAREKYGEISMLPSDVVKELKSAFC